MIDAGGAFSSRAAELRRAFDRSFAAVAEVRTEEAETVLSFRVAGDRVAVRLKEVAGVVKGGGVAPVPARSRALLGLAGIKGELVPVYSLAEALGYPREDGVQWFLLCKEPLRIAWAIRDFSGCFHVNKSAFSSAGAADPSQKTREVVVIDSTAHSVVGLSALIESLSITKEGR